MTRREAFAVRAMHYAGWLSGETKGRCKSQETFRNMMEWYDRFPEPALSAPAPQGIGREEIARILRSLDHTPAKIYENVDNGFRRAGHLLDGNTLREIYAILALLPTEPPAQGEG